MSRESREKSMYGGIVVGSSRQPTAVLDLVHHLHRFAPPSVRYALYPRRFHVASLAIRQLVNSLPS